MNIAVISFDQDLIIKISEKLSTGNVKGYTDSLSLLRDLKNFDPDIIIYDASGGELALNALEFFASREQIKGKPIKVLISRENPIDESIISKFSNLQFYDKETELGKLVEDISTITSEPEEVKTVEEFEEMYQPPQDIEALVGGELPPEESKELEFSIEEAELGSMDEILKELEPSHKIEEKSPAEKESFQSQEVQPPNNFFRITIELSPEEIKNLIIKASVEKLIEEINNDIDIKKLKEEIQKDFFDKLEKEMRESVDLLKKEIKEKLFQSIEADLKEKVKESIKEDVTRITTQLVREKLEQVFGNK